MTVQQDIERIEREYARLHDRIKNSDLTDQEILALFTQANVELSEELEEKIGDFIDEFTPIIYATAVAGIASQLGVPENNPLFRQEVDRLIASSKEIVQDRIQLVRQFKAADASGLLSLRNQRDIQLAAVEARIARGISSGENLRQLSRDVEDAFRARFQALDENKQYMFQVQDKNGHFRRVRFDTYAHQLVERVNTQTQLEAQAAVMSTAGQDIMRIPFRSGTDDACANYEGNYVSMSGENAGRTIGGVRVWSMEEIRAEFPKILHPNCRHFLFEVVIDPIFN